MKNGTDDRRLTIEAGQRPYKTPNKRIIHRSPTGQFRKTRPSDLGIGGICPECRHLLLHHYDGDLHERPCDPRTFVYRCFTCEPLTEAEQALKDEIEAAKPKPRGLAEMIIAANDVNNKD